MVPPRVRRIIIDTDPGRDDALAILLAAASPEVEVLGLTAVAGNVPLELTADNACRLADLAGLDVPVGRGAAAPLWRRDTANAGHVHGSNGLGGYELPVSSRTTEPAVPLLRRLIEESPEPVTLVTIGPLTNVALLAAEHLSTLAGVERIVMMGGAFRALGNVSPAAEFNVWFDPDAAARVLDAGVPVTMVPLDVTLQARVFDRDLDPLRESGGPVADLVLGMLTRGDGTEHTVENGSPEHDSVAVSALVRPELLTLEPYHVDVENVGRLTSGMTVVDQHRTTGRPPNVDLAVDIDARGFVDLLVSRLTDLDRRRSARAPG